MDPLSTSAMDDGSPPPMSSHPQGISASLMDAVAFTLLALLIVPLFSTLLCCVALAKLLESACSLPGMLIGLWHSLDIPEIEQGCQLPVRPSPARPRNGHGPHHRFWKDGQAAP
jgi:hypothetical protein